MSAPAAPTPAAPATGAPSQSAAVAPQAKHGLGLPPMQVTLPTVEKSLSLAEQLQRLAARSAQQPVQPPPEPPLPTAPVPLPSVARGKPKAAPASGPKPKRRKDYEPYTDAEERLIIREIYSLSSDPQGPTRRYFAKLLLREKRRRAGVPHFNIDDMLEMQLNSATKPTLSAYYPEMYASAASKAKAAAAVPVEYAPMRMSQPTGFPGNKPTPTPMGSDSHSHLHSHPPASITPQPQQVPQPVAYPAPAVPRAPAPVPVPTPSAAPASAAPHPASSPVLQATIAKKLPTKEEAPPIRSQPLAVAPAAASPSPSKLALLPSPPPVAKPEPPQSTASPQSQPAEQARRFAPTSPYAKPSAVHPTPKPPPTVTAKPPPLPMAISESPNHHMVAAPHVQSQHRSPFRDIISGEHAARQLMQPVISKFSLRTLKPFLRRDFECAPPQLAVLQELRRAFKQRKLGLDVPEHGEDSIDYCYIRPEYLVASNDLLRNLFWPGIDVGEWVDMPEFSVVVLYRRLVVGCAFISAAGYLSYLAVHPQWRGSKIARFMACPNKDITLHVSANNVAMMLYQQFGFKPEQFVRNFYEKYLPADSKLCKHAFFLRLRR